VPGCVYRIRPQAQLHFEYLSEGIYALCGYTAGEFMQDADGLHRAVVGEAMAQLKYERITAAMAARQPYELEYEMRHRDGGKCWVLERGQGAFSDDGHLLAIDGLLLDNSATHYARMALQSSSLLLRNAIESLEQGFAMFGADDKLVICNSAMLRMYSKLANHMVDGVSLEDLVSLQFRLTSPDERARNPQEFFGPDEATHMQEWRKRRYRQAFESELHTNKRWLHQQQTITPDGTTVLIHTDISSLKQLNLELAQAKEQAEEASRAKTTFLANMSHEVRTPLNGIIGLTDLTLETHLSDEQRGNLLMLKSSADQLLSIMGQILDFSRIEAGHLQIDCQPYLLHPLLEERLAPAETAASQKGLTLTWSVDSQVDEQQFGDPIRLGQILGILVDNAIKFTNVGGVEVNVARSIQHVGCMEIKVSDTGIGMSDAQVARLFRPFSQGDMSSTRRHGGTGLGLAICHKLVALLGGELSVTSEPDVGTSFLAIIPCVQPGGQASELAMIRPLAARRQPDILLIDFANIGIELPVEWSARHPKTPSESLRLITSVQFDLIVLCLSADMSELETVEQVRAFEHDNSLPRVPVLALTETLGETAERAATAAGVDTLQPLPASPLALRTAAARLGIEAPAPEAPAAARIPAVFVPGPALDNLAGDKAFLLTLLRLYVDDTARRLTALDRHLVNGESDAAIRLAHAIKGGSGSIGAEPIARSADQMEQLLRHNKLKEARELQPHLDRMFQQLCREAAGFWSA
jgi:signal transduction histidine kinase/HPt (histidine-containing phosphotransfer) domain-containing protein/CheY-like chemotaxis protein